MHSSDYHNLKLNFRKSSWPHLHLSWQVQIHQTTIQIGAGRQYILEENWWNIQKLTKWKGIADDILIIVYDADDREYTKSLTQEMHIPPARNPKV